MGRSRASVFSLTGSLRVKRWRLERSTRGMPGTSAALSTDIQFVDHAEVKLKRGPTSIMICLIVSVARRVGALPMLCPFSVKHHSTIFCCSPLSFVCISTLKQNSVSSATTGTPLAWALDTMRPICPGSRPGREYKRCMLDMIEVRTLQAIILRPPLFSFVFLRYAEGRHTNVPAQKCNKFPSFFLEQGLQKPWSKLWQILQNRRI